MFPTAFAIALAPASLHAATAKKFGQPISAYSASLFGKTNLSATQTQTLCADPDEPLFGSTSIEYDIGIVKVTGFGYGPGYEPPIILGLNQNLSSTPSGAQIELFNGENTFMMDLKQYLDSPPTGGITPTGYLQAFWNRKDGESGGKDIPDGEAFLGGTAALPGGVDTNFFTFEYLPGVPNTIPASYRVFDSPTARPNGGEVDFMASGNRQSPEFTRPGEIVDAIISGTVVPEPAALSLLVFAGALGVARRRVRC
jgi:hypothetical protein